MGTKKRKTNTNTKGKNTKVTKKSKANVVDIDLAVISMVVVGILLFVMIYAETGTIGAFIGPLLGGIIGKIKYIIPIFCCKNTKIFIYY